MIDRIELKVKKKKINRCAISNNEYNTISFRIDVYKACNLTYTIMFSRKKQEGKWKKIENGRGEFFGRSDYIDIYIEFFLTLFFSRLQ